MIDFKHLKEKKILCEIYDISNSQAFSVGYIVDYDNEFYVLENLDSQGRFAGFYCALIDNITKISTKTEYLQDILLLNSHNKQKYVNYTVEKTNTLKDFLYKIMKQQRICSITLLNELEPSITGIIEEIDDEEIDNGVLKLKNIDNRGFEDGNTYVNIEDITCVEMGSSEFIRLETLKSLR